MSEPWKIMTWYWQQTPSRSGYCAEYVNRWAAQWRKNLTIPHTLACVTDHPQGIDSDVEIIPLSDVVPAHLLNMQGPGWSEKSGLPQCYRRLALFHPAAAQIFGAEWLVSTDLDCALLGNCDSLFDRAYPFRMLGGTSGKRPYNGSMVQLCAGARPQVYVKITPEGIALSRKKFVGSDQAWISHVLGWDEKTWMPQDGVYAWSVGFVRANTGVRGFLLPGDARLIFFPANPKPWDLERAHPKIFSAWAGTLDDPQEAFRPVPRKPNYEHLRLWAYDDPKGWGKAFQAEAKKAGHRGWLFTNPQLVADGEQAFVRLDQSGAQRDVSRGVVARLHDRGILTLPTAQEGIWYDDKVAQHQTLERWLPETWVEVDREGAEERLEYLSMAGAFPIISKAAEGAGSANVRVLHNADEAWAQIITVFGTGIPLKYGRIQRGYIYWQKLVANNDRDYRVIVIGDQVHGLVRNNRPGTLFASGSGSNYPLTLKDDREIAAAKLGFEIASAIDSRWVAFDVVFDGAGAAQPRVLELSSAWTMKAYTACPMFSRELERTKLSGEASFGLAVQLLLQIVKERAAEKERKIA